MPIYRHKNIPKIHLPYFQGKMAIFFWLSGAHFTLMNNYDREKCIRFNFCVMPLTSSSGASLMKRNFKPGVKDEKFSYYNHLMISSRAAHYSKLLHFMISDQEIE